MYRILHLIGGLDRGGTEATLVKLLSQMDRKRFQNEVISLTNLGPLAHDIKNLGIPVNALGMHQHKGAAVFKLWRALRKTSPDLIQSWNHHSDFLALVVGRLCGIHSILWNIRCSEVKELGFPKLLKLLTWLSPYPTGIIVNSHAGQRVHEQLGYKPKAWHWIANGFDTNRFIPSPEKRTSFRQSFGLTEETILVGMIARFDPMKDHATFFKAATLLDGKVKFLLAGQGMSSDNQALMTLIPSSLKNRILLCGDRSDVDVIDAALDIVVLSSSRAEGFPNAIGEAMSCGIPCIVTDVGDCRFLVDSTGIVISPKAPIELSRAIQGLIEAGPQARQQKGWLGRERIINEFSLEKVTRLYDDLYEEILKRKTPCDATVCL